MSEGTSNVVMGSTTGAQSDGQETGSSVNMSLGTSTSNVAMESSTGAQSNEHVTSSSVNISVDTSNVAMESATPVSTEAADCGNSMMIDMN